MGSSGIGEPFCDDFYTEYYGYVEEMRLYCGNMNRQFVEGLTTRYGPKPGMNLFAWSNLHGGSRQDSQILNWIFTGKMITDFEVYHNGQHLEDRAIVFVNQPQDNGIWIERCKLKYIAGTDSKGSDNHIHSLSFYFTCRD